MYSLSQSNLLHLNQYFTDHICLIVCLSLDAMKMSFNVLPLLKYIYIPYLQHIFWFFHYDPEYMEWLCVSYACLPVLCCLRCWYLCVLLFILFTAHQGHLQWVSASCKCCSSVPNSSVVDQTVLALCVPVLMTLHSADMWWWLSHCKYWSACVGVLFIPMEIVPPGFGVILVLRKGIASSGLVSSRVNLSALSIDLMCYKSTTFIIWVGCQLF